MSAERKAPVRCAVYTRKSSEEGLDQSFNSLDAQREACHAYIVSQRQEGWRAIDARYDDGGYSGGTMKRPGVRRLFEDIRAGKVDVIVVYKVDRLTRSLADFAKMIEILDANKASFVSITQQFNTTSSMGRLTLNVLLSFAQFEREVAGERIKRKRTLNAVITDEVAMRTVYALIPAYASTELLQDAPLLRLLAEVVSLGA